MKVLLVLDTFYPTIDGPINVIVNIAKIINKNNWGEVELLVPSYPEKVEIEGVKIHRCKSMKSADGYRAALPMFDKSVKKLIKNGGYDLVHIHSPFTLGKAARKYAKRYKIPTAFTMHTAFKDDFKRVLKCKLLQNFMMSYIMGCINKCDYISTVSNGAAKMLKEYGCTNDNISVIRNGTDMKPIKVTNEEIENIKQKYNLKDNFVFLFVGRIVANKNIQFSLEVLNQIKQNGVNNFKFLIVGSGSYEEDLKKLVKDLNLEDNVIFAGRISDREYLAKIYASADLFMFPSTFDTCGIVAIEAAVNKLPSAMLENCCASEVINHNVNGLAMPNNVENWKNEIVKLIKNKQTLNSMKEEAFKTIFVSWEDIVKQYLEYYKDIIKNNK